MNRLTPSHLCFRLGAHLWESAVHGVTYLKWYVEAVELGFEQIPLTTKLCLFFSYSTLGKELENLRVRNQPVILTQHIKPLQSCGPSRLQVVLSDAGIQQLHSPGPLRTLPWDDQDPLPGLLTSYNVGRHQRLSLAQVDSSTKILSPAPILPPR